MNSDRIPERAGAVPRLAMINSFAGFGRCSTTVALPIISAMKVQVCPVPTSILSNHLGFPHCYADDYTSHMQSYLDVWKQLDLSFDGLYCGFLGSTRQADIVERFLDTFQPGLFLLDPVMGDYGRTYSTVLPEHCQSLRRLASRADILTPNLTEACLLTGTPYPSEYTEGWLEDLCEKLDGICPGKRIVITGIPQKGGFLNLISESGHTRSCLTPDAGSARPGTGDIFASILAADALYGRDFSDSVQKAADFVACCIKEAEAAALPIPEGVPFECCLEKLLPH